jgi:hypothetical protein
MPTLPLLALIILGVVGGIIATSMQAVSLDPSREVNKGTMLKVLDAIAAQNVLFNGAPQYAGSTTDPAALLASSNPAYGQQLFHPVTGTLNPPPSAYPDASATTTANLQLFIYRSNFRVQTGDATPVDLATSTDDIVMIFPQAKSGVCIALDAHVNGADINGDLASVIPSSGLTLAALTGTSAATALKVTLAGQPMRTTTCVRTTDGHYALVQVLKAR